MNTKKAGILVMAATVAALVLPPSSAQAVGILDAGGGLTVFAGWGASGCVTFTQEQEVIVGELTGVGATQGPGVNTITGAAPLFGLFTQSECGSFSGPGAATTGEATYDLVGTAPDGSRADFAECVQIPGSSRTCIQV